MNNPATNSPVSRTIRVPDGTLYYELRGQGPLVVLVGSPMDAAAFAPLAELLADNYTVLTTDPRGIKRSVLDDPGQDSTPPLRADDLARILTEVDAGPAVVFGSSGGAVTTLALTQAHPELVRIAIAHEPPLVELLEDREDLHTGTREMIATYLAGDVVGAWMKFMAQANIVMPEGAAEMIFGGPRDPQQAADERRFFEHELTETTHWRPDIAALRAASTHIVVGVGVDSAGQLCDRASAALVDLLDMRTTPFVGGHTGFVESPERFAVELRAVLADA